MRRLDEVGITVTPARARILGGDERGEWSSGDGAVAESPRMRQGALRLDERLGGENTTVTEGTATVAGCPASGPRFGSRAGSRSG